MSGSSRNTEKQLDVNGEKTDELVFLAIDEKQYQIFLPNASTDYIQKKISTEKQPYELPMLQDIKGRVEADDLVLDIGANIGNHTLYLAAIAGCKVVAIEPNQTLAKALLSSVELNGFKDRVAVYALGLGKERTQGHFASELPDNLGAQSIELGTGDIQVVPLDSLEFEQPVRLLKIDVEGMELAVLQGGETLLRKDRPMLYVECQTANDFRCVANWLDTLNYGYWDTFNATPTHLFLPNEKVDLESRITQLQSKAVLDAYESHYKLVEIRAKVNDANLKYREAQAYITSQKERLVQETAARSTIKQRLAEETAMRSTIEQRLEEETTARSTIEQRLAKETAMRSTIEQRLIKTRASLTYQLGYQVRSAATSVRGLVRLPLALWRICRQALKRRKIACQKIKQPKKNRISAKVPISPVQAPTDSQAVPRPISEASRSKRLQVSGIDNTLKVACIMDDFTYASFKPECDLHQLTPADWKSELKAFQPEMLFIESAWRGKDELWGSKVGHKSTELQGIVEWCRERTIPTVFWNKEDPVHFQTFLNTAKLFDYVFTTDVDCIHRYKAALGREQVYFLPFACQPAIHNPIELYERKDAISFAGAYYVRYPERARDLESFLDALPDFKPVEIYDRNYGKDDPNYLFPEKYNPFIVGTLPFDKIDQAYKGYQYAINLNSIKQSQTMFARRVFELLASNTITISNFSRGLRLMMGDLVITSDNGNQVVKRLQSMEDDLEATGKLKLAALRKVMLEHTYGQRLNYICAKVNGAAKPADTLPTIAVLARAANQAEADLLIEQFQAQTHKHKRLILVMPANVQRIDDESIHYLTDQQSADKTVKEVIGDADWIASMLAEDYYGPNYLLDIAIATQYSSAELIGKAAHFRAKAVGIELLQAQAAYQLVCELPARQAALKASKVELASLKSWLDKLSDRQLESEHTLAIDPYNYCHNAKNAVSEAIKARVDDLPALDIGLSLDLLQSQAESIAPADNTAAEQMLTPARLAELLGHCKSKKIDLAATQAALTLSSRLAEGKHEYLYASQDLKTEVLANDRELKCYLDTTPGLAVSLVILFLDAHKQRINHVIFQANRNATAEIPPETAWLRLGLRVLSAGKAEIKGLVLGHRDLQPAEVLGRADHLLLTNHYPAYHDLYRNGFVHSRVKGYAERGVAVDVFRLRVDEPLSFDEFEGVDVLTGDSQALDRMLSSGRYKSVLVHFLSPEMWTVLEKHIGYVKVIVWLHGAEIHPWHRRVFNYENDEERDLAKLESEKRMHFWHSLLNPMPANLHMVFVSNSFSQEVFEDLGFELPETQYSIIHNPIDTGRFAYRAKPSDQRKKILSIRPFASRQYANDISVQAIIELSKRSFFNDLEFRIIGNGRLFDETVTLLRQFSNVALEQRFLTHSEIAALHREYGIFLCPTRWDSQGVSRDEAMSSGLVPITNAVAAIPEFVDESCGILAPAEDAKAIAEGITELYENPGKFQTMSVAAAQKVRQQSAKSIITLKELGLFVKGVGTEDK